jgi:glycine/D-amino acid oxidase-like deaminating enzyme
VKRREFLTAVGASLGAASIAPALVGLSRKTPRPIAGGFVDDGSAIGHAIRDHRAVVPPASTTRASVVIVGGGIAGLSAAWELERKGFRDFVVLELERDAGGNARSGRNEVSGYPWAAHYVPVPDKGATLVRELFEELGVLHDDVWEERYLCFAPQERLFLHGEWHPGIEPDFALDREGRAAFHRFDELIQEQRATGQFTIPMERGVRRDNPLDKQSMAQWLDEYRLNAPALRWYIDYACRDDYGALARDTSAWAGVHYFASRSHDEQGPLTWPEGNGWIANRLTANLASHIRTATPVLRIERAARHLRSASSAGWNVITPSAVYRAEFVIFAAPRFIAPYVVEGLERQRSRFAYSPWLTANLTLERSPEERGSSAAPSAWDNVIYDSPALGYVVATHQSLRAQPPRAERSVWTFYWSFAELEVSAARRMLMARDWPFWRDRILADLERVHPDIRDCVTRVDVMRHGHAMIRPTVGFLTEPERLTKNALPRFVFAHSDESGLSLFEEAQYQGVMAARRALGVPMKHHYP